MTENFEALREKVLSCNACRLCEGRTNVVFGVGSEQAKILLIGEGPGRYEDEQGIPFVGKAGALLDDMLAAIGLHRGNVYIANTVKCRPPDNRDPLNEEKMACRDWLERQIRLLQPKIIICLGRHAAKELIREDFQITNDHGRWFEKDGILLSRKRDNEPGVGMASMEHICHRYGGTLQHQWDEEAFTLLIMLPITAEE